jgi:hypothetical protein
MFHVSCGFVLLSSTVAAQEPPNPNILQDNRPKPAETGLYLTAHTTTNSLFFLRFWERPCPDHLQILARQQQTAACGTSVIRL